MINLIKARTPLLAFVLSLLAVGYTVAANKVVVVPLVGDAGISGYEVIEKVTPVVNIFPDIFFSRTVTCPGEKLLLGGGCFSNNANLSYLGGAANNLTGTVWSCLFINRTNATLSADIHMRVQCANIN